MTESKPRKWALAIHGGAGAISREFDPDRAEYMHDLRHALSIGAAILRDGGAALDAVIACAKALESSPLFNAGVGSVLTAAGRHELDAGLMRGSDMASGAVAGVTTVRHPIVLARAVLESSPHVLLVGDGAEAFATLHRLERVENSFFTTPARLRVHQELMRQAAKMEAQHLADSAGELHGDETTATPNPPFMLAPILDHSVEVNHPSAAATAAAAAASPSPAPPMSPPLPEGHPDLGDKKFGTVGAVALDMSGDLATAVSTGGMSLKSFGRVGDSPIIGSGFYATRDVAVSCTGNGEAFMRCGVARDVTALMEYRRLSVVDAAAAAIANGERLLGSKEFEGGLIAVDASGRITMPFNSHGMYRGFVTSTQEAKVAVWPD